LGKVVGNWFEGAIRVLERFAAVPHDGAQVRNVGRRKWAAIGGDGAGTGAAVGVVVVEDGKFSVGGNLELNANEAFVEKKAVGFPAGVLRGDVLCGAAGAIIGAENGVGAARGIEALLDVRRSDAPRIARLVAGNATPAIRADVLKESVLRSIGRSTKIQIRKPSFRIGKLLIARYKNVDATCYQNSSRPKNGEGCQESNLETSRRAVRLTGVWNKRNVCLLRLDRVISHAHETFP